MIEKYCDILVIGSDLPGLITAAFLARRGLSVQIVDFDLFSDHEKALDPVCLTNVQSKLVRSILGRLNVPEMTIQNFTTQDSTLQFIFPQSRVDILPNPLLYFEEIEREFPEHLNDLKLFYENQARSRHQTDVNELFQQLLPSTWKEKRLLKKFIKMHQLDKKSQEYTDLFKRDKRLNCFLRAQFLLAYQCLTDEPFNYQIAELFNPGDGEIFSVHGGVKDLKKILIDRITQYDGNVRKKVQINKLLYRNGVFEGVELDNPQGSILAKYIIWNAPLAKLKPFIPKKWRFYKLRKRCDLYEPDFHWFSARFRIESQYIPDPMRSSIIDIQDENKELIGTNMLSIQINKDKVGTHAFIDVNFLLPKANLTETDEVFQEYFQKIKERLYYLMPFSERSLELVFPCKQEKVASDTLFPLDENDFEIFRYVAQVNGVSYQNEKHFYDLFKLNYKTPAPNFYITHSKVFLGFGLESKLMLGLKVTDLIWQEAEKTKKRAMKSERRIA